jgi:hypothetical protein
MNSNLKRFLSLSVIDSEYFNNSQDKFELEKCPKKDVKCNEQLSVINKIYIDAEFYRTEKDYKSSIETLRNAFYVTTELTESACTKCAEAFRAEIIKSVENIHFELKKITSGIFGNKNYRQSLTLAENVRNELKSFNLRDTFQIHRSSNKRYIENDPKRNVS